MNKEQKKAVAAVVETVVLSAWFMFLWWSLRHVPAEWRMLATFAIFYLSRIAGHVARAVKLAVEIVGD